MNTTLLFFLALVVSIALFYFSERYNRRKALNSLENSNGTFDEHAQTALDALDSLQCPNVHDQFLAARLIDLNGHDGRINNVRILNNVVNKYMGNLRPYVGKQPHEINRDNLDWFELDQIENFADRHMDIMVANPHYNDFIDAVLQARPKKVVKTLDEVKSSCNTRKEAFDTYVANNVQYTNDSQNVHDSAVNEQLRKTWRTLKEKTIPPEKKNVVNQIRSYIQNEWNGSGENRKKALRSLEEIQKDKFNGTLGASEMEVCATVWERSNLPINAKNRLVIRDAIVDSLSDMTNDGSNVVCSNGRCARLMESLVLTDADDRSITGAMTVEQIRNDAFKRSNEILQETVASVAKGHGVEPELQKVARSYDDPSIQTDAGSEMQFKELVKGKVDTYLQQTYSGKLSEKDYSNIRDHCIMAIDSI